MQYTLTFLSITICTSLASAQILGKPQLDSIVSVIQETFEVPGLAVGVIVDGELYYSAALGVQDLDNRSQMSESSLFHMASVSKPFVATAVMQLVEAGKMSLDDLLVDHLPYFTMDDPRHRDITIKQILNHSSGIPDVEDYEWDKPQVDDEAAERYARSFGSTGLDFGPGEDFSYSNASFDIMAAVISKASGMTFEEYMTQYIFEPAGMKNSTFFKPDVPKTLATSPHGLGDDLQLGVLETYPYNRIHAPSSTLHSNIEDLTRWAQVNLNHGTLDGRQVYSPSSYAQLTTPTIELGDNDAIGLSWFSSRIEGTTMYAHSGGDDGYRTYFAFFPEKNAAVFTMGNCNSFRSSNAAMHIARLVFLGNPGPWKRYMQMDLKDIILTEGIDSCKSYYYLAEKTMADQYSFTGDDLDQLGYWLLDREEYQAALDIFMFNLELRPENARFHDSVGDAYIAMGDENAAIEWYEKALVLNPEQYFTIEKLKELKRD